MAGAQAGTRREKEAGMLTTLMLAMLLAQTGGSAGQPKVDIARGKELFDAGCAGCHGPAGEGGKGPRLAVPKLPRAKTARELVGVIMGGIPGTEMPPSWYLTNDDVRMVVAYVRQLGATATPPRVEGDVAKGMALFNGKGGCSNCHTLRGVGHAYGPDLTDIGARRTASSLRESLINPSAEIAPEFLEIHLVTRDGAQHTGIRLNEDSFTIQIIEPSGRVDSYRKEDLTALEKRPDQSSMPNFKTAFSDVELQDLVAYLSSLRGEQ
jgi:cytochrome c oxidase cbb3-type subunit III